MMNASRKTSPVSCIPVSPIPALCIFLSLTIAACGGSSGGGGTTPPPTKSTPTVTVTPESQSITTIQSLSVTVTVSGSDGTPTGSVVLSSGSYTSAATTLTAGSASITVPGGALAAGSDTLSVSYTPDTAGSASYNSASGTGPVVVTRITPTVTVTPGSQSITTAQSLSVTVSVSGGNGAPTSTGSVVLSSGTYTSSAVTLTSGSASITVPAGALAAGSATLTANYTPDTAGSAVYNSASGIGGVTVTKLTPTVTVTPGSSSITTSQSLSVTVTVSGGTGAPTPTGSVVLSSGSYTSASIPLTGGNTTITIAAGALAVGVATPLDASYTPDTPGSAIYNPASGSGSVTVTPSITSFTANPTTITVGATSSLTGVFAGGTGVVTPGNINVTSGTAVIVTPAATTTYTLTVTPSSGTPITSMTTVTVVAAPAITSFTANPTSVSSGTPSALTGVFTGGTGVITPGSLAATSGTAVSVSPTTTTTYTLTVTNAAGTAVTATATVTVATSVTVNPASPGIAVTNQLLGMNMAVWYDFTADTPAIVDAFQSAGIVALRWPGGSTSDVYHWNGTSASNPANGVAPTPSACEGAYQSSNTNYLNFITDFEHANGAPTNGYDVALTADYGTNAACTGGGEPSEAASWVEYAYANGGTVSHVTVGNEVYGGWEEDMHAVQHDPTTYANAVAGSTGYYELIKAQSSSTLVGVAVDANCTTADDCTDGWDKTVLANAVGCNGAGTPCYDFVEYHFYPQNSGDESDTFLVQQAAQVFTTNINTVKQELATANQPNTPIYVGEMGSVSSNPGKQSWSITQGLFAGQMLGEMMNDGVTRATWWIGFGNCNGDSGNDSSSLYGWQNFGAYNVFADASGDTGGSPAAPCDYGGPIGTMSPTAQAFNLFQNVAVDGEHVLIPTVGGDTTDVRAYAATHSGGTALVLFNVNETTSQTLTVTVDGETTSPGVTVITYDKSIYDQTESATPVWANPTTTNMGTQPIPLTLTLAPWSMNVVLIQ
jgi:alpha-L-arabinofuranosidase